MNARPKNADRLQQWEIALLLGVAVFLLTGAVSLRTQDALADKVVRLHVLAHSDSEEDQALKLLVRDCVLDRAEAVLADVKDRESAEMLLRGKLPEFERAATEVIRENGYGYPVYVELADTEFPTKEYDGFTLPAGEYLALRVVIGEGAGQNWWCVVFPPVCMTAGADVSISALSVSLDGEEIRLVTEESGGYVLKFKAVELWERLRQTWDQRK